MVEVIFEYKGNKTGKVYTTYFGRNCRVNITGYILRDFVKEFGIKSKTSVNSILTRLPQVMGFAKEEGNFKEFYIQTWQVSGDFCERCL